MLLSQPTQVSCALSWDTNYYARFVPHLSTLLHPLNALLHKEVKWEWSKESNNAFCKAKEQLASKNDQTYYDPALSRILACDALPYGVGAVISHKLPSGKEKHIAFASRKLSKTMGILSGVSLLSVQSLPSLLTDHRPLTTILCPSKAIPSMAAVRLQRWALLLAAHNYTIKYWRATDHGNTDSLSCMPLIVRRNELTLLQGCVNLNCVNRCWKNCTQGTSEWSKWRPWHGAMCGGRVLILRLKTSAKLVCSVNASRKHLVLHLCTHGSKFISISLVCLRDACSLLWLMPTLSGLKSF